MWPQIQCISLTRSNWLISLHLKCQSQCERWKLLYIKLICVSVCVPVCVCICKYVWACLCVLVSVTGCVSVCVHVCHVISVIYKAMAEQNVDQAECFPWNWTQNKILVLVQVSKNMPTEQCQFEKEIFHWKSIMA